MKIEVQLATGPATYEAEELEWRFVDGRVDIYGGSGGKTEPLATYRIDQVRWVSRIEK